MRIVSGHGMDRLPWLPMTSIPSPAAPCPLSKPTSSSLALVPLASFADTLLTESPDTHITIVDPRSQVGGSLERCPSILVALHQPSSFYGVNSLELGTGRKYASGVKCRHVRNGDRYPGHGVLPAGDG